MAQISVNIEQALRNYLQDVAKDYRLGHVILFGSTAYGTTNRDSDIDLAIFSYNATDDNRLKIMADCWMKTMGYHLDIQPIVFSMEDYHDPENDFIQKEIIAKGIELPLPAQQ